METDVLGAEEEEEAGVEAEAEAEDDKTLDGELIELEFDVVKEDENDRLESVEDMPETVEVILTSAKVGDTLEEEEDRELKKVEVESEDLDLNEVELNELRLNRLDELARLDSVIEKFVGFGGFGRGNVLE
ncbi:hypothetical protein EJ08DRAFT_700115 [Tothia fuscella]|uniref:Uncharacterized protein n=1 Tax=Tothia fuscella TaxID=1048955 RepID=A0A9P4TUW2_9PEZI|nr:hypothetical protein EJ08DRAFT_700115 [Tothia fuscella]